MEYFGADTESICPGGLVPWQEHQYSGQRSASPGLKLENEWVVVQVHKCSVHPQGMGQLQGEV